MKIIGEFNNLSKELVKELIPDFKPNQIVSFRLLNGQVDIPTGRTVFGSSRAIRLSETIYDPYKINKSGGKGDYVEIGVPKDIKDGRVASCKKHIGESPTAGIPWNGTMSFTWGNVDDMQTVEFMLLSSKNGRNPHRDVSRDAEWEIIDAKAEREEASKKEEAELMEKLEKLRKSNPEAAARVLKKEKTEVSA